MYIETDVYSYVYIYTHMQRDDDVDDEDDNDGSIKRAITNPVWGRGIVKEGILEDVMIDLNLTR